MFYTLEEFEVIKSVLKSAKEVSKHITNGLGLNLDEMYTVNEILSYKAIGGAFLTKPEIIIAYKSFLIVRDLYGEDSHTRNVRATLRGHL